ncbi:hypothetical protein DP62_5800 [Burkholderia pseudomallei]|nr:hypothetical protein DP62_5800 [Burkholderia pseudomallei]
MNHLNEKCLEPTTGQSIQATEGMSNANQS